MEGQEIREWRTSHGMTLQGMAERLGVSFTTLHRWEQDKTKPSRYALLRLQEFMRSLDAGAA